MFVNRVGSSGDRHSCSALPAWATEKAADIACLCAIAFLCYSTCFAESQEQRSRPIRDPHFCTVQYGRSHSKDVPPESFVAIDQQLLPKRVNGAMYSWAERIFTPEASPIVTERPLEPGRMTIRVFAASNPSENDLVEYRWNYGGFNIRLLSTIDVLRIELDLDQITQKGPRGSEKESLRHVLQEVLRLDGKDQHDSHYAISLPFPDALVHGTELSSNPEQDLNRLTRWHQRVDAFVEARKLCVLIYKKPDQLMQFRDGSKWFPDDFRQLVHEKARQEGKLPPPAAKPDE